MEIIREGPSASRPPILDGKNYLYWKPRMIFFIKTLDGKAWRALVAGYDPPMITINGVSVLKPEVDWIDAEEQASIGNAKALNAIFNGVDLNVFKKFDMKVTAIEEAHDITTLKLDELFSSLLTFEMTTVDRESKKGKKNAFKSTHVGEEAYRRRNDDGSTRRNNQNFDRRSDGYIKKKEGDRRIFRCRECGGVGHYQAECPTFLRNQKKSFRVTLSDEESESKNDELTIEKLEALWKEDCEAREIQKEKIQDLIEENERFMSVISSLKLKLREVQNENDQILKSVKMLNSGTENLYSILKSGHNGSHKHGLGFVASRLASRLLFNLLEERVTIMVEKTTDDAWYFDSGCSRHMTGNRSYFANLKDFVTEHVTFGDGAKGKLIAKGNIDKNNLPRLNDVRYVDGLKANLISISQLCDQGYKVSFDDVGCVVLNKENQICMSGPMQTESLRGKRVTIKTGTTVTLYELWKDRKPNFKYFHVFGNTCYILADREYRQNKESFSVINDLDSAIKQINDDEDETPNMSEARTTSIVEVSKVDNSSDDPGKSDSSTGMQTRRKEKIDYMKMVVDLCYISTFEPSTVDSALKDVY
ncbi:gag-pol polyprotein, related [Cucumis melo var. makuwa]|uniref:Gag-pol polyprotein, related n=1 Tax=Cucumis melo var. makuwa TaxID=1194695 RepID=A0A5A7V3Q5_CUCMM|nr:gag-pol polyprotein, related [Cucumis melo var. makuwa]TYK22104.1 gag-pol polyprotein, related [Cucumis melo var. makuwa]